MLADVLSTDITNAMIQAVALAAWTGVGSTPFAACAHAVYRACNQELSSGMNTKSDKTMLSAYKIILCSTVIGCILDAELCICLQWLQ